MSTQTFRKVLSSAAPIFAILAVCLLLFIPWWKDGKACAPLDIVTNLYEPWADANKPVEVHNHNATDNTEHYLLYRHFIQQSLKEEGRVGWNPLKGGGTAEYANTMATPGDFTYILYRLLPFWTAWNLGLMLQYMIAMLGMFVLLRFQKYGKWLCLAGALAYGLNAHFAAWVFHRWALGAFCWTPWYLWALLGIREKKPFGVLAPLFIAASFFGGHIQYAAFQVFVCMAFGLAWYWDQYQNTKKLSIRPISVMVPIGIIAVLLASIMFIPCVYALHVTMESGLVRGGLGYPDGFLAVIKRIIAYPTYIFPVIYGGPGTFSLGRVLSIDQFNIPFFGSLFVLCAFAGIFIKKLNVTAKTLVILGLVLPTTPLVGPMYERLLMLFILGGIWLAIDLISNCPPKAYATLIKLSKVLFTLTLLAVIALGIIVFAKHDLSKNILTKQIMPSVASHRFSARPDWFEGRIEKLLNGYYLWNPRIWLSLLGFGVSVWMMPYRGKKFFGPVLSLCILCQLWIPHKEWMTFTTPPENDTHQIYPSTEETEAIQKAVGTDGSVVVAQSKGRLPLFPPNSLTYFGIQSINVYDSILPNGMKPHNNYNPDITTLQSAEFFSNIGTTHLVTFKDASPEDSNWILQKTVGKIAIYSNTWARAKYVAQTTEERESSISPSVTQRNYRKLELPNNTANLSICENHAEGWKFKIDNGEWAPMSRAEDGSMFTKIEPKESAITFELRYDPLARKLGKAASLLGLIAYLFFAFIYLRNTQSANQASGIQNV